MDEYISRKAAIEDLTAEALERNLDSVMTDDAHRYHRAAERVIAGVPAADVRPVRYGKWEKHGLSIRCSECGYDMPFATRNFCPNCGAMMEES